MVFGFLEFFCKSLGMRRRDPRNQYPVTLLENFTGNLDDLNRRFTGAENNLRKALAQGTMLIHLREAEISDRLLAERRKSLCLTDLAGAEIFKQLGGLGGGHTERMPWLRVGDNFFPVSTRLAVV